MTPGGLHWVIVEVVRRYRAGDRTGGAGAVRSPPADPRLAESAHRHLEPVPEAAGGPPGDLRRRRPPPARGAVRRGPPAHRGRAHRGGARPPRRDRLARRRESRPLARPRRRPPRRGAGAHAGRHSGPRADRGGRDLRHGRRRGPPRADHGAGPAPPGQRPLGADDPGPRDGRRRRRGRVAHPVWPSGRGSRRGPRTPAGSAATAPPATRIAARGRSPWA